MSLTKKSNQFGAGAEVGGGGRAIKKEVHRWDRFGNGRFREGVLNLEVTQVISLYLVSGFADSLFDLFRPLSFPLGS